MNFVMGISSQEIIEIQYFPLGPIFLNDDQSSSLVP